MKRSIFTAVLAAVIMQLPAMGQKNLEYIHGSWSHSETVDTSLSEDSGGNSNKDATYQFVLAKPSVVVIDHAGSGLERTCISLMMQGAPISMSDTWSIYAEGSAGIADADDLIQKMRKFYPMSGDLERDLTDIGAGQAFLCTELPAGFYAIRCEGTYTGSPNEGPLTTNFRFYALGSTPEEAVDMGTLSGSSPMENLYYTMTEREGEKDDMYFKFHIPSLMTITVDGIGPRGSKGILELLDSNLNILDHSEHYPRIKEFFPQIREVHMPEGNFFVRVSRDSYYGGLQLYGMNIRPQAPDEGPQKFTPDTKMNYVASLISTGQAEDGGEDRFRGTVDYYDHLGRPVQSVMHSGAPYGTDIILSSTSYDSFGRVSGILAPAPSKFRNGTCVPYGTALQSASAFYEDTAPESITEYTQDALSKVTSASGPGEAWQSAGKAVKYNEYSCALPGYRASGPVENPILVASGTAFADGYVIVSETVDEDGTVSRTYCDKEKKVLCIENADGRTYYAYNRLGQLCFVLPPQIGNGMPSQYDLDNYAFMYRYDVKNRCIGKKFPGAEWEEYIYDNSGCLIMSQDGNLRARGEWKVTIPDIFGRAAVSGFFNGEPDKNAIASSVVRATPDINSSYGYSVSLPLTDGMSVAEVLYYDNYDFLQLAGFSDGGLDFTSLAPYGDVYGDAGSRVLHKGLMTGRIVSVASGEGSACDAYYYDYRKRLVQSRRITPEGGQEVVRTKYTYIGEAIEELMTVMPRNGAKTDSLHTVRVYDRAGRLMSEAVELNGGLPAVTTYSYDAVGRVASVAAGLFGQVATTSFGYNTRNWMTGQNTVSAQGDTLFAADLRYNSGLVHPGSVPLYAGNISEWQWQNADGRTHTYSFSYDASGRLTGSALFSEGNADGSFTEDGIIYDRNGNIIGLTRTNGEDEFAKGFAYQGNMLKSLCGKDETSGEYLYDGSGNMTHDGNNGLDLEYNRMNLMQKVTRNGAAIADYRYLYDGTKTIAIDGRGEGLEYHGPLTYRIGKDGSVSLSEAHFTGGRFVRICDAEGDAMEPVYTFTDHLGSVRAQASSGGDLMEHDNYLPFGTRWNDGSPTDPDNRYRFNGKEEQSFAGLPYIDYGARMYDPCTARWLSQDPLAEKYYFISPYAFCSNNPVNFVDPDGRDWKDKWLGFFNALVDNITNGVVGDRESGLSNASDANDYQTGLIAGDTFSLALGAAEIGTGGGMITGGEATAVVAVAAAPGTGGVSLVATAPGIVTASVGAAMVGHGTMMMAKAAENLGNNKPDTGNLEPRSANQLQKEVERGKAPKGIDRFDGQKGDQLPHVHFKDGAALYNDGTWRHNSHKLSRKEIKYLERNGWKVNQ